MSRWPGFTLVELLIGAVLLGLLGWVFLLMVTTGRSSLLFTDAQIRVQEEARRGLETMVRELRETNNLDSPATNPNADFTDAARLNFQLSRGYAVAGCTPNAICWGNDSTNNGWVHYLLNGTQLVRCQSTASDTVIVDVTPCRVLANDLQSFLVTYANSPRTATLRLRTQHTSQLLPGGSVDTGTLTTHVRLRNP